MGERTGWNKLSNGALYVVNCGRCRELVRVLKTEILDERTGRKFELGGESMRSQRGFDARTYVYAEVAVAIYLLVLTK